MRELEAALEEQAVPELAEGEPVPAPHLSVWGKLDWALLALGVIGLLYFLAYRNTVFPAATKPLEVDAISARRAAEDLAARLGRPFPGTAQARLEYRGEHYWNELFPQREEMLARAVPRRLLEAHRRAELPVYWQLDFSALADAALAPSGGVSRRYAIVDRRGRVQEVSNPYPSGWVFPKYQPAPIEQRRAIATNAVELACGPLPPESAVIETSGGEQGASYSATIRPTRPLNSLPWAEVSLLVEKVVSVNCQPQSERWEFIDSIRLARKMLQMWRVALLFALLWVMFHFGIGQCYRSPILWKRLPLACVLGVVGVWQLAPLFDQPPNAGTAGPAPSLTVLVGGGLAAAGLILVALVTSEYYFVRRTPAWIASYSMVWRGRFGDRAVALALVRGALAGVALAGVETLVFHVTLRAMGSPNIEISVFSLFLSGLAGPATVGQATASFSPALFVIAAAVFSGVTMGLLFIGMPWALAFHKQFLKRRTEKRYRLLIVLGLGFVAALATIVFHLPFAQVLSLWFGHLYVPLALFSLVAVLFVLYDVLTVMMAVGTAVLWNLNFPLLQIYQELGNAGQWAVFIGWGVLVAAAAAMAFRGELVRAVQRARAEMQ